MNDSMGQSLKNKTAETASFLKLVNNRVKFSLFMLTKLPAAFFSGVRVIKASEENCEVSVPFKWFSQNPFKSTYFACLSMAAEMSTGLLAMAHSFHCMPQISMLVVEVNSLYFKKATGKTYFTCTDGKALKDVMQQAIATGQAQTYKAKSIGVNSSGEPVAEFLVTWSFKAKKPLGFLK